jgi:hypothetical protein
VSKLYREYIPSCVITVVKELRLKMFRQHPGYYKVVFLKTFVNARYSGISIDRNDFDARFLITFRKKSKVTLQKTMIFGQKITIIIITIIKHHNSKHYIYSIFIKTDDNRRCLL